MGLKLTPLPGTSAGDAFLKAVRELLRVRLFGEGGPLEKAVTFRDLVDLGLVSVDEAKKQAER